MLRAKEPGAEPGHISNDMGQRSAAPPQLARRERAARRRQRSRRRARAGRAGARLGLGCQAPRHLLRLAPLAVRRRARRLHSRQAPGPSVRQGLDPVCRPQPVSASECARAPRSAGLSGAGTGVSGKAGALQPGAPRTQQPRPGPLPQRAGLTSASARRAASLLARSFAERSAACSVSASERASAATASAASTCAAARSCACRVHMRGRTQHPHVFLCTCALLAAQSQEALAAKQAGGPLSLHPTLPLRMQPSMMARLPLREPGCQGMAVQAAGSGSSQRTRASAWAARCMAAARSAAAAALAVAAFAAAAATAALSSRRRFLSSCGRQQGERRGYMSSARACQATRPQVARGRQSPGSMKRPHVTWLLLLRPRRACASGRTDAGSMSSGALGQGPP